MHARGTVAVRRQRRLPQPGFVGMLTACKPARNRGGMTGTSDEAADELGRRRAALQALDQGLLRRELFTVLPSPAPVEA